MHAPDPDVPAVTPAKAKALIDEGALLIDVREMPEWSEARIPDAIHRPMSDIQSWYEELPKDRTVVIQCATGRRSEQVTKALVTQAGYSQVVNMLDGIVGWHEQGLPISTSPAG